MRSTLHCGLVGKFVVLNSGFTFRWYKSFVKRFFVLFAILGVVLASCGDEQSPQLDAKTKAKAMEAAKTQKPD
jgi:hypothetical protein